MSRDEARAPSTKLRVVPTEVEGRGTRVAMATNPTVDVMRNGVATYKSPLHQMTQTTATCLWNDSAAEADLTYSLEHGAVGATCNPVIVLDVLKREMAIWKPRILALAREIPNGTEGEIAWRLVEMISATRAAMLLPVFEKSGGRNGRLSIQTDPRLYRDSRRLIDQAIRFSKLAPNMIVKLPVTRAGIEAIEEVTARGVSINATVSFSLPQALAVGEAVERGFRRLETQGGDISTMGPVCTIMVGRLDDWLKVFAEKRDITIDPGYLEWAGVALFKKAYRIYRERGYRFRLLSAAFRNHMHWSEFIGGEVVISPPCKWQMRYNASDIPIESRIDKPVDPRIIDELQKKFTDFRRAYAEDGLSIEEFDTFPPTRRTLRQFIDACQQMEIQVRNIITPDPDIEST
jgi:transaldolase